MDIATIIVTGRNWRACPPQSGISSYPERVAYAGWADAVKALKDSTKDAGDQLLHLAAILGIEARKGENSLMLTARIEDAVAAVTGNYPPRPATTRQTRFLNELRVRSIPSTFREADGLIKSAIADERRKALEVLRPVRGDRLVVVSQVSYPRREGDTVEVSSIDCLGQVWTKGARGFRILPQHLSRPVTCDPLHTGVS